MWQWTFEVGVQEYAISKSRCVPGEPPTTGRRGKQVETK
jgi:hypothetical protein